MKEAGLADDISLAAFTSQPVPASMLGRSNPMGLSAEGAPYICTSLYLATCIIY